MKHYHHIWNQNFLLILISSVYAQDQIIEYATRSLGSPAQCVSINGQPGGCVLYEKCPLLLKILKEGPHTASNIRLLQRLTCGFEKEEPLICCPVTEIVESGSTGSSETSNEDLDSNPKIPQKGLDSKLEETDPSVPLNALSNTTTDSIEESDVSNNNSSSTVAEEIDWSTYLPDENEEFISLDRFKGKASNFKHHVNFKLLPKLKECSHTIANDRIVGGTEAALASYPWMARIGYRSEETGEIDFYCAGTIINKRYILTAGHCTEEIDVEELTPAIIRVGEHDSTKEEDCSPNLGCTKYKDYKIEKIIPHEFYNPDDKANDIELIRVDEDISFDSFAVSPVCLPFPVEYGLANVWRNSFSPSKNKAFVTGWGRTKWNKSDGSTTLQEVQLPIISNAKCASNYTNRIKLTSKQMCAGGIKAKDSCGGDSGGPLMFPVLISGEGKFFQLGVVSFGPVQCGVGLLPGVYTRVSAYRDWILNNIKP